VSTARSLGIDMNQYTVRIGSDSDSASISGASAYVDAGGELRQRITATRLVAPGPFAVAFKKTVGDRNVYLAIENQGFVTGVQVDPKPRPRPVSGLDSSTATRATA
jgi:hypothetical protein